jgi:hypothetical protein
MKKIIRQGVFESNSSSSHSISIVQTKQEFELPKTLHFAIHSFHDYPEDGDWMDELSGRANYLYSISYYLEEEERFKKHMKKLLGDKVNLVFGRTPKYWEEDDDYPAWHLINHQVREEVGSLFYKVMHDDVLLMNYLFDDKTDIEICSDGAIKGVKDDEGRLVIGYGRKRVEEW